jgi:hypothetical protein
MECNNSRCGSNSTGKSLRSKARAVCTLLLEQQRRGQWKGEGGVSFRQVEGRLDFASVAVPAGVAVGALIGHGTVPATVVNALHSREEPGVSVMVSAFFWNGSFMPQASTLRAVGNKRKVNHFVMLNSSSMTKVSPTAASQMPKRQSTAIIEASKMFIVHLVENHRRP